MLDDWAETHLVEFASCSESPEEGARVVDAEAVMGAKETIDLKGGHGL